MGEPLLYPHDRIAAISAAVLEAGGPMILQGNRLGSNDYVHVAALMSYMQLPQDGLVVDLGSGFGEVTRIMSLVRPDLRFILVNGNAFQAEHCMHDGAEVLVRDMHDTGIAGVEADLVMMLYSFCHADPDTVLREAHRIAAPKGGIFIYDYERVTGTNDWTRENLCADFRSDFDVRQMLREAGWSRPKGIQVARDERLWEQFNSPDLMRELANLRPIIWKATKPC